MASLRISLSVLFVSLLLVAPQANLLRSRTATGTMKIKDDHKTIADVSSSDQSGESEAGMSLTIADFEDPADDARAEAGAEADAAFGADESIDQDYMDEPDVEANSGQQGQQADLPSDNQRGVFNLETGRFEKSASLLQTGDVDDVDEQEDASDESEDHSSDDVVEAETSDDSEDQASDDGEEGETSDDSQEQNGDDVEESSDVGDDMDVNTDESLLQTSGADDDDDRMGQEDAKAAEAEALKEAGGEEDEEKTAEREEAEQEEIESMNADAAYNFDGIS